jgi:hypothetical protein
MNTSNVSTTANTPECCVDFCETSFTTPAGTIVNSYACNQRSLTNAGMWQIRRDRKTAAHVAMLPEVNVHG